MLVKNKIIGISSYCKSSLEEYKDWGEIISIYLLPEYIGKGYGKSLLEKAIEKLKAMGFTTIFLWVLEDNHRARHFYKNAVLNSVAGTLKIISQGNRLKRSKNKQI